MNRAKMFDVGNQWEDLRKQARQLENEIDLKLISFSKLGTSYSSYRDFNAANSDSTPLLNKASSEHMFDTMAMEIEQLLARLTEVNDGMADYTQNLGVNSQSAALLHTLQRHRDILQDYSHEFQKTKTNIVAHREREDLLGSVRRDIDAYKNSSTTNRRSDLYLKEHDHIRNSERLVDEQISIAIATKENLQSQKTNRLLLLLRLVQLLVMFCSSIAIATKENLQSQKTTLKKISETMNSLANRFPVINSLVQRVNLRKRRDTIILGLVISVCFILLILYQRWPDGWTVDICSPVAGTSRAAHRWPERRERLTGGWTVDIGSPVTGTSTSAHRWLDRRHRHTGSPVAGTSTSAHRWPERRHRLTGGWTVDIGSLVARTSTLAHRWPERRHRLTGGQNVDIGSPVARTSTLARP
ncbi:Golgi SNAP receptor complex member 1 [Lamellibrachia satsuma]|nr:Golgi SNAP receptor complex member 1 [Lamellibrachia satsuma]